MKDFLIYAEKPSAARRFSKFLKPTSDKEWLDGHHVNTTGTFMGKTYHIEAAHGYLMNYDEPSSQVKPELKKQYASWKQSAMPWNYGDLAWKETYIIGRNPKTHRKQSDKKDVMRIGRWAMKCRNIIVFSDNDPSGAGDDLAMRTIMRIIKVFGWHGNVYRGRFKSDTVKAHVISALTNVIKNPSYWLMAPKNPKQWNVFMKGISRSRWDYMSMQLTRLCTSDARDRGYNTVVNEGRLKSVMLYKIYEQLMKRKNYKRVPYYEVRFKDENGHVFSRKASAKSHPDFRHFNDMAGAKNAMAQYHASAPAGIKSQVKKSAPGPLLNLSALSSKLAVKGYSANKVLSTYQNLYEAGYVSYPRTADKKITKGDFNDLLPKVNSIAKVVGVNPALLTHRTIRPKYCVEKEDHGANRPGMRVPKSLSFLREKYGQCGVAIYQTLAKNYLAILCEDYVYKKTSAHLADYPKFTSSFNQPVKMNYKLVFDNSSSKGKNSSNVKPFGKQANPGIYTGSNPKPTAPTENWIMNFLNKNNVGTGATQTHTFGDLSKGGKRQKIRSKRGKLSLTQSGLICAVMVRGTFISSAKVTKQLFDIMDGVAKGNYTVDQCVETATELVKHDKPIMERNSESLMSTVGKPKASNRSNTIRPISRQFQGQEIKIWPDFFKKACTQDELRKLFAGDTVTFTRKGKYGTWHPKGKLVTKTKFNGKPGIEYVGKESNNSGKVKATVDGKEISYWPTIMGKKNKLTKQHIKTLNAGGTIKCVLTSGNGKTRYKVAGKLSLNAYKGHPGIKAKFLGFVDD